MEMLREVSDSEVFGLAIQPVKSLDSFEEAGQSINAYLYFERLHSSYFNYFKTSPDCHLVDFSYP